MKAKPEGFVIMTPQNEAWARVIEDCYKDAKKVTRYAIKKNTEFDRERLQKYVDQLPAGYVLREIDSDIYDKCLDENLYPSWDAQNMNSVRLAESLGYEYSHDYVTYEVFGECRTH